MILPERKKSLESCADLLMEARETKKSIGPITVSHKVNGLEEAYAVAALNVQRKVANGDRIVGKKVGLTSVAVQNQLGVDQPDFGILFNDMEYLNNAKVPVSRLMQPKIEAEIAFIVGKDLTVSNPSWSEFLASIQYALPALEIVDSAITDWKIKLEDTVADNASCGLYVLGDQPIPLGVSLGDARMELIINDEVVSTGSGADCLGHPLRAAYWLACTMAEKGEGLKAGEIILSGALGPMAAIKTGDKIEAKVSSLGSVSCEIVQ